MSKQRFMSTMIVCDSQFQTKIINMVQLCCTHPSKQIKTITSTCNWVYQLWHLIKIERIPTKKIEFSQKQRCQMQLFQTILRSDFRPLFVRFFLFFRFQPIFSHVILIISLHFSVKSWFSSQIIYNNLYRTKKQIQSVWPEVNNFVSSAGDHSRYKNFQNLLSNRWFGQCKMPNIRYEIVWNVKPA